MNARPDTPSSPSAEAPQPAGWLPHPALSLLLAVSWLALSHSLAPVHLLSAALIGLIVPRLLRPFLSVSTPFNWPELFRLGATVLWDIVVSNITVAKLVLGPIDNMKPAWITVPLDTPHPRVNAWFATIITTTPGTVSAVVDEERGIIMVHALNCDDADAMAAEMKQRYEAALLRVFRFEPGSPS
jgi:multicomponent K+:H+ antiporter subunit E